MVYCFYMSPELIQAIKERIKAGQTREEIEPAVIAMGHTKEVFEAAFTLASHDLQHPVSSALPRARTLFKNAWNYALTHLDVAALLFIPLALETIGSFWFERVPESERFVTAPLLGLFVLTGVAYIVTITIALKMVSAKTEEQQTFKTAAVWMVKNALPLLWIYVLSGLVIFGGLLFFIIPGLVVAISVTFAQYTFVADGKKGMSALHESRLLVKGRWLKVVRKIAGFIILSLIPLFLFGIAYGIVTEIAGEGMYVQFGGELLTQAISAVISLMSLHAMYHLYLALKETSTETRQPTSYGVWGYRVLIGISLMFFVAVIALATFFREKLEWIEEAAVPIEEMEAKEAVPAVFSDFDEVTLQFANERNGSYLGVCEALRPLAEAEGEVVCNDSDTAWALQTTDTFGNRFCADYKTPGKVVPAPIGVKTECISVGE